MSPYHHDHSSDHPNEPIPFSVKAHKLIDHWIKHNEDHTHSYRQWSNTFRLNGLESAAVLLETAAELTGQINLTLSEALRSMDIADPSDMSNR